MPRQSPDNAEAHPTEAYAYPPGPWLRANMVSSADGAATVDGRAKGLSSEPDRRLLQLLRGLADVILVGAGTVRRERYGAAPAKEEWQPLRRAAGQTTAAPALAVLSRTLDLDPESALFAAAQPGARTIVLTTASAPTDRRRSLDKVAEVIVAGEQAVDLNRAVAELTGRGHSRLLTEGGPHVLAEIVAAGLLDELCLTLSPLLTAGDAQRILNGASLPDSTHLELAHILEEDSNLFLRYVRGGQ